MCKKNTSSTQNTPNIFFSIISYIVISATIAGICTISSANKDMSDPVFLTGYVFGVIAGCLLILTIIYKRE